MKIMATPRKSLICVFAIRYFLSVHILRFLNENYGNPIQIQIYLIWFLIHKVLMSVDLPVAQRGEEI